ncbi:MAG: SRPBCC family protein [Sphingomonadales bacterium]
MRGISFFLASLLILFLLLTCIGLFLPARVTISRAVDIARSRESVYPFLSEPARWRQWFPGAADWPLVKTNGQTVGIATPNGNTLLIKLQDDSTVVVQGLQAASIDGDMGFKLIGSPADRHLTVQWYMNFYFDWYPWERFSSLLLENKFGTIMEQGLKQLEQQVQSDARTN